MTSWILDSVAMCHMTPQFWGFIPGSLEDTDKYIEVTDEHFVTAKQEVQAQMIMCDNITNPFIVTLHNVIMALDLYNYA